MDPSSRTMRRWPARAGDLGLRTRRFAVCLGGRPESSVRLLVVGTPDEEPWHFTAHLRDHAERFGRQDLHPTLLRWQVPAAAPPHLSRSVDYLAAACRDETVLVVSPEASPGARLLERVHDARRRGARILSIQREDQELTALCHEVLELPSAAQGLDAELSTHAVSELAPAVGTEGPMYRHRWRSVAQSL